MNLKKELKMKFSAVEIKDLVKSWLVISLAFAIAINGLNLNLVIFFIIMLLTVGSGFLLHELAHKYAAQKFGYFAEFKAFNKMLLFAVITSFFGFVFAAPGGVFHQRIAGKKEEGLIALAGPAVNIILSLIFGMFYFTIPFQILRIVFFYGAYVNSFLAVFNLIPFFGLDGAKVFQWSKTYWAVSIVLAGIISLTVGI